MNQTLTLQVPNEIYKVLQDEAESQRKTVEQVVLDWMAQRASPRQGSLEAITPFFGAWKMTPEERTEIEHEIDKSRHQEEDR
jgi:diketogulonate reductase-like aldo/keto reductase